MPNPPSTRGARPILSIVIAATDSAQAVVRLLGSLQEGVTGDRSIEVIVAAATDRITPPPGFGKRGSVRAMKPMALDRRPAAAAGPFPSLAKMGSRGVVPAWLDVLDPLRRACPTPPTPPLQGGEGARHELGGNAPIEHDALFNTPGFGWRAFDPGSSDVILLASLKNITWIEAERGSGVPRLRRLGLDRARGEIVVLTEDSCVFGPAWVTSWRSAFDDPRVAAATGPVAPAMGDRLIDWAVFFFEYALFLKPSSPPTRLAGNNFAVRRSLASQLDPDAIEESDVQAFIENSGDLVAGANNCLACHVRQYSLREAIADRLRFGRAYGRLRAETMARPRRGLGLVAGPLIWLVQLARMVPTLIRSSRHLGRFIEALPILAGLVTAWSVGEWLGWMSVAWFPSPSRKRYGRVDPSDAPAIAPIGSSQSRCTTARPPA